MQLIFEQLISIWRETLKLVPQFAAALIILVLTYLASVIAQMIVKRVLPRRMRPSLKNLFVNLTALLVWLAGITIAAVVVFPNLTPSSVLAGLGLGSVAIGFAFKDVFENFLAGVIILFRREMRIGDHIECEGLEGKVESISIRETHIRQTDGQLVIVPNGLLFKNPLKIRTDLDERRTTIICGIAYGEDVAKARSIIEDAVRSCASVITDDRPVQIFAQEFGSSSIDFEVTWWTGSEPVDIRKSRDEVVEAVKSALDNAQIEIPFPYRTLTFAEPLPLERREAANDG